MQGSAHYQILLNASGLTSEQIWFLSLNIGIAVVSVAMITWLIVRSFRIQRSKSIEDLKARDHRHIQRISLQTEEAAVNAVPAEAESYNQTHSGTLPAAKEPEEFHSPLSEYYRLLETFDLTEAEGFELEQDEEAVLSDLQEPLPFPSTNDPVLQHIYRCLEWNKFLVFSYQQTARIVRPISSNGQSMRGYCYLANTELEFDVTHMTAPKIRDTYAVLRVRNVEPEVLEEIIDQVINEQKPIRIRYVKPGQKTYTIDQETWELLTETAAQETSLRTIVRYQRAPEILPAEELLAYELDAHYIHGFCLLRHAPRTFKIDRIQSLEVLNI
ncbi:MAG: hypothetical protein ACKOAY_00555 [Haliscomenobacter sp.]